MSIWQITGVFFRIDFLLIFEFLLGVGHFFELLSLIYKHCTLIKVLKKIDQSNGVKVKVVILWTHINMRNKVEKVS